MVDELSALLVTLSCRLCIVVTVTSHYGSSPADLSSVLLPRTEHFLASAVREGAFPGAAYGVVERGVVRGLGAVGRFTYEDGSPSVEPGTSFDLASVTKVVATTAMAMLLHQRGELQLDMPLGGLLPHFIGGTDQTRRGAVTLRLLLAHASGLPAYEPFFEQCRGAAALQEAVLALPLEHAPGTRTAYSDPGFILLGMALEALVREPLCQWSRREVFEPLGMTGTRFCPEQPDWPLIPPSEEDTLFRHRRIQGEVQDENCFVLGGVSGHAGLFAPTRDLLAFAESLLRPLQNATEKTLFRAETVQLFSARADLVPGSSRALGWDTPSGHPSSSGSRLSRAAFGHLGFAGTSLWIDPVRELGVVLLTNRSFPSRENRRIQEVRPRFHDTLIDELDTGTTAR